MIPGTRASLQHAADSKYCVRCGHPYAYAAAYVGHLGDYRCPACGHERPPLDVAAREIELEGLEGSRFRLDTPHGSTSVELSLPGLYNVYNAVTAASVALALQLAGDDHARSRGLQRSVRRFERIPVGAKAIVVLLIKNPAAANEALRLFETGVPPVLLIALNDAIADGQDVSWIWDVDFEPLLPHVGRVVASGGRASELGLRLVYAGLPEDRLEVIPSLEQALDRGLELVEAGTELVILPDVYGDAGVARCPDGARLRAAVLGRSHAMKIRVGHLYPEYLNIYADRGNIAVLARRAALRGHELAIEPIGLGERVRPGMHDFSTSVAARIASRR